MISDNISKQTPLDCWNPFKNLFENSLFGAVSKTVENSYQQSAQTVSWMIENRGGLAKLAGLLLVPAQYMAHDHTASNKIIDGLLDIEHGKAPIERITIPMGKDSIEGVICYPKDWKKEDNSRCIVYHNPNGVSVADFSSMATI